MLAKIILVLLLNISLFGQDIDMFEISFHGNFCGNNTPKVHAKTTQEEIEALKKIPALDVIDEACKRHDICYLQRGDSDLSCDNELVNDIEAIRKKLEKQNCKILAKAIIIYFDTINYNPITIMDSHDSVKDKLLDIPSITSENMFRMGSFAGDMAINYGYSKPAGYIFDSKNNKERLKEIFQLFPPKNKVCTTIK